MCGAAAAFSPIQPGFSRREARCPACGAAKRVSDLAGCLARACGGRQAAGLDDALADMAALAVFEAQAAGPLHEALRRLPGYRCSEYLPDQAPLGGVTSTGVRCEDLTALTWPDASFDVVITQDVLEHVPAPWVAFQEIWRVLRPGGRHFFTVPVAEGHPTTPRTVWEDGRPRHLLPPVHHGDPLRAEGSLVTTDFGGDLPARLAALGMPTEAAWREAFYQPGEMPGIIAGEGHARYLKARRENRKAAYFLYNSIVFVTTRPLMAQPEKS